MMGVLADINVNVSEILAYIRGGDDDEWEEEEEEEIPPEVIERIMAENENHQALLRLIERGKIELATGKRPPPDHTRPRLTHADCGDSSRRIARVSVEEYRRQALETWDAMAAGWERRTSRSTRRSGASSVADQGLAPTGGRRRPRPRCRARSAGFFADRGRGRSRHLDRLLAGDGRGRATAVGALGLTNVEHRVMSGDRIELEDDSVDGVLCRFGYMLMPDPAAAFAETRRVLKPGGRLAFSVWRGPERNPWLSIAGRILVSTGASTPRVRGAPDLLPR